MKVFYKTVLQGECQPLPFGSSIDVYEYKVLKIDFCCDEMRDAEDGNFVGFGDGDAGLNRDNHVNIYKNWGYGCDSKPITLCPFCGKPVTTVEKERVKLVRKRKKVPAKTKTVYVEKKVS